MKMPVALVWLLAFTILLIRGEGNNSICKENFKLDPRPHSVSILEFGAVGDGKTLNTLAFQNAIFYLKSFADKGGAQLYVPPGKWLTGSFNLTSHLTLFLEKGATILASPDPSHWDIVSPLPSYGRGIELPGKRYRSLINGDNLIDVVITGENGTFDGQGAAWWEWLETGSLNYSRPHIIEFVSSKHILISNLTFLNAPSINIHPVYCSQIHIRKVLIETSVDSPYVLGVAPDSSDNVCIEDSTINVGHDAVSLKSGWDQYGIHYGRPTTAVHIRNLSLKSPTGAGISFGSEMSGGISDVTVERLNIQSSHVGVAFRTTRGRGGYIRNITISDVDLTSVDTAIVVNGHTGSHPDDKFDRDALPVVTHIVLRNFTGVDIGLAGNLTGIGESPFTSICLADIHLQTHSDSWICSNVSGFSDDVSPEPCQELMSSQSSCFAGGSIYGGDAAAQSYYSW
ncbi:Glycoside hydrolase family 28 [Arabidopsis thaliana x Arabidopsis arenosa]|uniref:Glycoside hydrolase family 28 n=1 Tax=Arabidopsis thaliana x Arabidopsis arenosa TaxID=1240361 RepID=A0A8T2AWV5_9BRAS|nr:Glycoside hydrolase family 28 [Arabidopsis thaliana x Arabidopsis arenosa]